MAKKFNGMENHLIQEALKSHVDALEKDIKYQTEAGKRLMYAPGFFRMIEKELSEKVDDMTIKSHLKKNNNYHN